ncbi:amino acid ABC transporter permease [Acidocella sp. MX-AZ02]|uniref:amino acid ABC transporter permease n=2 Tax=unclassified Acidocella TaxID=2648610 RepID=UPI00028D6B3B|nr:amino acid ABC transporter permease [Acidocella sp. MX-AZ02]EKN01302.1 ABC transporter permease [Acidocella sp. MX-AZ02]
MMGFTTWDILRGLLLATRWTLALSAGAFVGGVLAGLIVLVLRVQPHRRLAWVARIYIEIFQSTPLLMQLFLAFFAPALLGLDVPAWAAAWVALSLWTGAFLAEIWRGSVEAVPAGQWEAGGSLGMSYLEQLRHIILPQALRIAAAPSLGFMVQVIKGTALTSIIGFVELEKAGTAITNATFHPFTVYGLVALIYFCLCYPIALCRGWLERRLNAAHLAH